MSTDRLELESNEQDDNLPLFVDEADFLALPEAERLQIESVDTDELREKIAAFVAEQQRQRSIVGPSYWD